MKWHKISERQWVAGFESVTYRVTADSTGFWAMRVSTHGAVRMMLCHPTLRKAKQRCEADRILG